MLRIRSILTPVDFSERSIAAARHAAALARRFDAKLIFAHVIPNLAMEYMALAHERPHDYLDRLQDLAGETLPESTTESLIAEGDPAEEIARLAEENHADLIVMATHGYGPLRRFLSGSVTARVLRKAGCPVLTGAHLPEASGDRPYRVVACAVELTPHSETVLRWAADFAADAGATLEVIHAAMPADLRTHAEEHLDSQWERALVRSARQETERLVQAVGCRAELYVDDVGVTECVQRAVATAGAGLLVIGRSVRQGLADWLHTNAFPLIRESPCPVISV